jgi:fatty-acid desaturase
MTTKKNNTEKITVMLVAGAFAALGGVSAWRGHWTRAGLLLAAGLALLLVGLVSRRFAAGFHRRWMRAAYAMGSANAFVLLTLIYLIGFSAYGAWVRMARRDSLGRRSAPRESYWVPRMRTHPNAWQFERLY